MKNLLVFMMVLMTSFKVSSAETPRQLEIGDAAPELEYNMKDVSGEEINLNMVKEENGLLVLFTCNTCPFVIAWEDRYPEIAAYCEENNIGLIAVNPNEARRSGSDSFDAMQQKAKDQQYDFYYTYDENHVLADAFGATKTPDVFLFNADLTLAYKGAIDDNHVDAKEVTAHYLSDAISNMLEGKEIDPNATKSVGCSIKRLKPPVKKEDTGE